MIRNVMHTTILKIEYSSGIQRYGFGGHILESFDWSGPKVAKGFSNLAPDMI